MANVEPLELRSKMQEFRASTCLAALARFRKYLKPDIITLFNHTQAHNIAQNYDKRTVNEVLEYQNSEDTPKRANKVSPPRQGLLRRSGRILNATTASSITLLVTTKRWTASWFPAKNSKLLACPTSTRKDDVLTLGAIGPSQLRQRTLTCLSCASCIWVWRSWMARLWSSREISSDLLCDCAMLLFFMWLFVMFRGIRLVGKSKVSRRYELVGGWSMSLEVSGLSGL